MRYPMHGLLAASVVTSLVMVLGKLVGLLDTPWVWVTSPLWSFLILCGILAAVFVIRGIEHAPTRSDS